jgi:hypothetical protein
MQSPWSPSPADEKTYGFICAGFTDSLVVLYPESHIKSASNNLADVVGLQ